MDEVGYIFHNGPERHRIRAATMASSSFDSNLNCTACGINWSAGKFTPGCEECGGGALQHACLVCSGTCGAMWSRAVLDSQDAHEAHWVGRCYHQHDPCDEPDNPPRPTTRYLFHFGFETPAQRISNARGDWDDQDSATVFIDAPSKREAVALGCAYADLYVLRLFEHINGLRKPSSDAYLWSEVGYAHGLEENFAVINAATGVAPVLTGVDQLVPLVRSLSQG